MSTTFDEKEGEEEPPMAGWPEGEENLTDHPTPFLILLLQPAVDTITVTSWVAGERVKCAHKTIIFRNAV